MKFFVDEKQRHCSYYYEFQKGYFNGKYWLQDSISIHDMDWDDYNLTELFGRVLGYFDEYGENTVTKTQWDEIVKLSQEPGAVCGEVIAEAIPWVNECFKEYEVFTIIGL